MTDITLTLDHHEFYFAVRGFINGSHLTQDVFGTIIFPAMRQMDAEFENYLWWVLRKNHFDGYMRKVDEGFRADACGAEDYMHALAMLHRRNRFMVKFVSKDTDDENVHEALCYKFQGTFRPLRMIGEKQWHGVGFNSFIPDEWVECSEWIGLKEPVNEYVEAAHLDWWKDIDIYNTFKG